MKSAVATSSNVASSAPRRGKQNELQPVALPDGRCRCPICEQSFKNSHSFRQHRRTAHGLVKQVHLFSLLQMQFDRFQGRIACPVDNCMQFVNSTAELCLHMSTMHAFVAESVEQRFASWAEFEASDIVLISLVVFLLFI
jgi:hypothetical protein